MKRAFLLALSMFSALSANEETLSFDSGQANYDGKNIVLTGNVSVEHDLGKIFANHVILTPLEEGKKIRLAEIKMDDQVKILLKDGAELTCDEAELDYQSCQGRFYSTKPEDFVVYTEKKLNPAEKRLPVVVKSKTMSVHICKDSSPNSLRSKISEIAAQGSVAVAYNNDFVAEADSALYQRSVEEPATTAKNSMPGLISMQAVEEGGFCQLKNKNGDVIQAGRICIDTVKRHIHFAFPKGTIYTARDGGEKDKIDFLSDTMTWEEPRDFLSLQGHVEVNQPGIGSLVNDKEVVIYQYNKSGKKRLRSVESDGKTVLTHTDEKKGLSNQLVCYGKAILDHEHLQTTLESPQDPWGNVLKGSEVYFKDALGEIFADKAVIDYDYTESGTSLTKVTLYGNVRILNRKNREDHEAGELLQYALADKVEFLPASKEMLFSSNNQRRVLFFDKANSVQVSAPALKISREKGAKSDSIKGIGDVRFSFADNEFEQLRRQFDIEREEKDTGESK